MQVFAELLRSINSTQNKYFLMILSCLRVAPTLWLQSDAGGAYREQGNLEESPMPLAAVLASRRGAGTIKEPDHHRHSQNKNCIRRLGFEGRGHLMIRLEHLTTAQWGWGPR